MVAWLAGIALAVAVLGLFGVDVTGWFESLWDALTGIGFGYLVAGWSLQTLQTTLTALGWYFILRAGYPDASAPYRQVLAAYAAGVALNGFLPANIGTFVMLLMFIAIIPGANLAGVLGGMLVQKIFFTLAGAFVTCTCSRPCRARSSASSSCRTTVPAWGSRSPPPPWC